MLSAAVALLLAASSAQGEAEAHRFVFAVGENRGDAADEPLHFAVEDARRFLAVMSEVGQTRSKDAVAQLGTTAVELEEALGSFGSRLAREARPSDQLVVYVSSHAAAGELHLHGTRFPISRLVDFIKRAPVGFGMLIVDSCESGEAIRVKGLRPLEGTVIRMENPNVTGRVIITSSGASEYAQESDSIGGSYFTHHFLVGLRGAADSSSDGKVTLQEAYSYAYSHTVESTFATRAGVQHPSFDLKLEGKGDVVLSWPAASKGRLRFVMDGGDWLVLSAKDEVVGQLSSVKAGTALAVAPGLYRVRLRSRSGYREARIEVPLNGEASVSMNQLAKGELVAAVTKGGAGPLVRAGAGASGGSGLVKGLAPLFGASLWLSSQEGFGPFGYVGGVLSCRTGLAEGEVRFRHTEADFAVDGGWVARLSRLKLDLGAELGATVIRQSGLVEEEPRIGIEPRIGGLARATFGGWPVAPYAALHGGMAVVRRVEGLSLRGFATADLGIAVEF